MPKRMWTPDLHTHMLDFPKLLPQSTQLSKMPLYALALRMRLYWKKPKFVPA